MNCRHARDSDGRRIVTTRGEHTDPLPRDHDPNCTGCAICDKRHCTVCAAHLWVDELGTCITCLGDTRANLTAILDLAELLPAHALTATQGQLVASSPIPGGDAVVMLAPGSQGLDDDGATSPLDRPTPAYLLSWWEENWHKQRGQPIPTNTGPMGRKLLMDGAVWPGHRDSNPWRALITAHAYLHRHLHWAAANHPGFGTFATDLATLRRVLEDLLYAGDRPAEGVACFTCDTTLVRDYRDPRPCRHAEEAHRAGTTLGAWLRTVASYPELGDEHAHCDQGGLTDPTSGEGWHCPRCRRTYTAGEYLLAVQATYDQYAPALPATELARRLGVEPATIWSWAQRGYIRRRGKSADRRTLYDVRDATRYALGDDDNEEAS